MASDHKNLKVAFRGYTQVRGWDEFWWAYTWMCRTSRLLQTAALFWRALSRRQLTFSGLTFSSLSTASHLLPHIGDRPKWLYKPLLMAVPPKRKRQDWRITAKALILEGIQHWCRWKFHFQKMNCRSQTCSLIWIWQRQSQSTQRTNSRCGASQSKPTRDKGLSDWKPRNLSWNTRRQPLPGNSSSPFSQPTN
mgnify:CR=1 FL=1